MVAFMRKSKLLFEGKPELVLDQFRCNTLEKAFHSICINQISSNFQISNVETNSSLNQQKNNRNIFKVEFDMSRCKALMWKHFYKFKRNPYTFIFVVTLAVIDPALFCLRVGQDLRDVPLGIVNEEQPPDLSNAFISFLEKNIISAQHFPDLETAKNEVRKGKLITKS